MRNAELGITGMMVCNAHNGDVLQILEGPAKATQTLYDVIKHDLRHTIRTVQLTRTSGRTFPGWAMALLVESVTW